jgi:hypothetical protein
MSTGLGGGLINGTPTGITGVHATVTVTEAGGAIAATTFMITPAGLTGAGPYGSAICVTAEGYAVKTSAGYTIETYKTGSSAATYHVTATFYGVRDDGGLGVAFTAATIPGKWMVTSAQNF